MGMELPLCLRFSLIDSTKNYPSVTVRLHRLSAVLALVAVSLLVQAPLSAQQNPFFGGDDAPEEQMESPFEQPPEEVPAPGDDDAVPDEQAEDGLSGAEGDPFGAAEGEDSSERRESVEEDRGAAREPGFFAFLGVFSRFLSCRFSFNGVRGS